VLLLPGDREEDRVMNRRTFLNMCAIGSAAAAGNRASGGEAASRRPNILFFFIDDQRYDTLGIAGHRIAQTPAIDNLARQGVRFQNAFVTTSICAASRASVLTGLTERTHGFTFGTPPIRAAHLETSYPAALRAAGYRTGFVGKFGVQTEVRPEETLFDYFSERDRPYLRKQPDGTTRHIDEINMEHALGFLDGCSPEHPFCLSVCFSSTHAEDSDKENHYPCIDAVKGMFEDTIFPPPLLDSPEIFDAHPAFLRESMNRERFFWRWDTPEKYQKNMRAYFRLLAGVDSMIAKITARLQEQGLAENTVIVYASDNGYYMAERGFAGKWSHYEESLRVPLIIYDPRMPQDLRGRVLSPMALNIDIPATLLDLAGVPAPERYQGRSLMPWINGESPPDWRTGFFCEHRMKHEKIPTWEGIRGQRYVYARYDGQTPPYEFLHDLEKDPYQLHNYAADEACAATLEEFRKRTDAAVKHYQETL